MAFASRTGTKRTIAALKQAGWGWVVAPADGRGPRLHGMPHFVDNGAWTAHTTGRPWDARSFLQTVEEFGPSARFIVVPDVVGDREASLARTMEWLPALLAREDIAGVPLLFSVQDGMTHDDVEPHAGGRVGIFIGGSTEWKERAIIPWGKWARARQIYCHAGRVNTTRRVNLCIAGDVQSFDGTSIPRYPKNLAKLDQARRQRCLFAEHA